MAYNKSLIHYKLPWYALLGWNEQSITLNNSILPTYLDYDVIYYNMLHNVIKQFDILQIYCELLWKIMTDNEQ